MNKFFITAHSAASALSNGRAAYFTPEFVALNGGYVDTSIAYSIIKVESLANRWEKAVQIKATLFEKFMNSCNEPRVQDFIKGMSHNDMVILTRHYYSFNKLACCKHRVSHKPAHIHATILELVEFYQSFCYRCTD